jgi:uncharacterized protein YecA (UPF0149 family)
MTSPATPDMASMVMAQPSRSQEPTVRVISAKTGKPIESDDDLVGPSHSNAPKVAEAGRNDPCPCGSGKKYKKCHGA